MHDLGWSHTKIYLTCITLFLTPRQPSLQKAQMERHALRTGPMDSFMGPNSLCGYNSQKISLEMTIS